MLLPGAETGPCTRCGEAAPMILPAALRYDGPPVFACPVEDMFPCEGRFRTRAAAPLVLPAPKPPVRPAKSSRRPRPSQTRRELGKTLLGQR